jgi:hypothetical protein
MSEKLLSSLKKTAVLSRSPGLRPGSASALRTATYVAEFYRFL